MDIDNTSKDKMKKIFFAKGMCLIMVVVMSIILLYNFAIDNTKKMQQSTIIDLKEERFDKIYIYILELQKQSYAQAKTVSSNIESSMRVGMDLDELREDLESGTANRELHDILKFYIEGHNLNGINNCRNGIIVASSDGILEDSYYKRAAGKTSRSWETEIKRSYNKELEENAINDLLYHTDSMIMTESVNLLTKENSNFKTHKLITDANKNSLRKIYISEGIEGFINYQVLVPVYITDNGDIFGQEDIENGIRNETHKIIVIQEFNIYDQILANYPEIANDDEIVNLEEQFERNLTLFYIIGIFWAAAVVIIVIYFSGRYNNYIEKYNLDVDDDEEIT